MFNDRAKIRQLEAQLATAQRELQAVQLLQSERAVLVSIARSGKELRLMFVRNGKVTMLETYATIDLDVPQLKAELLEPLK